jgi:hypothetical protein
MLNSAPTMFGIEPNDVAHPSGGTLTSGLRTRRPGVVTFGSCCPSIAWDSNKRVMPANSARREGIGFGVQQSPGGDARTLLFLQNMRGRHEH